MQLSASVWIRFSAVLDIDAVLVRWDEVDLTIEARLLEVPKFYSVSWKYLSDSRVVCYHCCAACGIVWAAVIYDAANLWCCNYLCRSC